MNPKSNIPHSRPRINDDEIAAVAQALRAGRLSQGEEVARLEKDLSALFDGMEAVAVSSGTAALYLALVALGVQKGDKVVIPSYTCQSLYAAVSHAGGAPVCADAGKNSVCMAASTVKSLLPRHASRGDYGAGAIIVPHMFGFTADIKGFEALGCPVIEDCAQAVGGRNADGSLLGSRGKVAILSFYGTKLLPAGEGGACITRDKKLAETIRLLRNCDEKKMNPRAFNFKMADLNAALARAKLQTLKKTVEERERIARRYDLAFGPSSFRKKSANTQAVCFRYLVMCSRDMDTFLKQAALAGIICRRPVWEPLHWTLGGECPRTEELHAKLVSVPIYPGMVDDEVEKICATVPKMLA